MASSSLYRDESLDDESGDSSFDDYEESVEEYSEEEEESDEKGTTGEHHVQALVTVTKRVTLASEEEESSGERVLLERIVMRTLTGRKRLSRPLPRDVVLSTIVHCASVYSRVCILHF